MTGFKNFILGDWNVRGLNDDNKCELIRDSLTSNAFDVIFLQETKLQTISSFKRNSFLPASHDSFEHIEALGTAGGILTSWNSRDFKCCNTIAKNRSLTVHLQSENSEFHFWATNVYGPTVEAEKDEFFEEIRQINHLINGPWIVAGDFNTVRSGEDRSTCRASLSETSRFNNAVRDLLLQELPLLDRDYTWSNLQHPPILTRIDRVFINSQWDLFLPNTTLHSIPRITSDHCPLKIEASTTIPRSKVFRYENNWKFRHGFADLVAGTWRQFPLATDTAKCIAHNLKQLRSKIGVWRKTLKSDRKFLDANKFVLAFMDWLEEGRPLSQLEFFFRNMVKNKIEGLIHCLDVAARQRGKVSWCVLGDEDTTFYHARASARCRNNQIKMILHEGLPHFSQEAKLKVMTDYYRNIMGSTTPSSSVLDFQLLYPNMVNLSSLSQPFSEQEILHAIKDIPRDKSPGPDGFGSGFYQDFWHLIKNDMFKLFDQFYHGDLKLDGINRSFMILLRKKENNNEPTNYRPISLLNCTVKWITKILAARLQSLIKLLVDADQTGFVKTRCIADNFMYAMDLVQCCRKRKKKAMILKLDFSKAFDTVSWEALFSILHIRGFDDKWIMWMKELLTSAKTAVLLNGIPGNWINLKRGLRQGDPLSPLLFIVVVDVLQQAIKRTALDGLLRHPVLEDQPCPVLQYADDTLIVIQGEVQQAKILKEILDDFANATGLKINFAKSTFVPINLSLQEGEQIAEALNCKVASFPQTYLGLPLSDTKLPKEAFLPYISSVEKRIGFSLDFSPIEGD
jgi:exonuclease III